MKKKKIAERKEGVPYEIDPNIKPLIDLLNRIGLVTGSSCAGYGIRQEFGHKEHDDDVVGIYTEDTWPSYTPYVYFNRRADGLKLELVLAACEQEPIFRIHRIYGDDCHKTIAAITCCPYPVTKAEQHIPLETMSIKAAWIDRLVAIVKKCHSLESGIRKSLILA
jgi:hypothetical protein